MLKKIHFLIAACIIINIPGFPQVNVAVDKPVTVDSEISSQPAWKAVEGLNYSNSNRWVSDDNGYPHWIEVDLQSDYNVEKVIFYVGEYGTNHPVYDYQIQSWDGSGWVDIVNRTGNTSPEVTETFPPVNTTKIRLFASSGEGNKIMLYEIEIYASYNLPPTVDEIKNPEPVYFNASTQTVMLSGISAGDTAQNLSIIATSSNTSIVGDPIVNYTQADSIATLLWSPVGEEGETTITVTLKDDGGTEAGGTDTTTATFDLLLRNPEKNYRPTIDPVVDVYAFSNESEYNVILKNISDGDSNKEQNISIEARSIGNDGILEEVSVDYESGNNEALLSFITTNNPGIATIQITVKDDGGIINDGIDSTVISCNVNCSYPNDAVQVNIDLSTEHQKIEGFGGFGFEKVTWAQPPYYSQKFIDDIIDDLGVTIIRVSIETFLEPENENNDPDSLDLEKFRQNLRQYGKASFFPFLKDVYKKSNPKIIASAWTPPAWMKTNNSTVEGGHLKTNYYGEFAEYIVAFIKLMKEETGIDLYAVSLQNEPTFWEPYESCQYTPRTYCDLIQVVGQRFEKENIKTKLFYPEEVFVRDWDIYPWMETLNSDTIARKYVDIMALHGYDNTGIEAGSIGNDLWEKYRNELADFPAHPKQIWMTETSGQPNTLEGALLMGAGLSNAIKYGKLNAWVYWTISGEVTDPENPDHVYNLMLSGHKLKKYFMSKQYYRYVRPGAISLEINSDDVDILSNAFINKKDSTLTYILINRSSENKVVNFSSIPLGSDIKLYRTSETEDCELLPVAGTRAVMLPAKSISTLTQSTTDVNLPPTINSVADTVIVTGTNITLNIPILGISDGNTGTGQGLTVTVESSNSELINNPAVLFNETSGTGELSLPVTDRQTGEAEITVTVSRNPLELADTVFTSKKTKFMVIVNDYVNVAPTFSIPEIDTIYISDGQQNIYITDISDGNDGVDELIAFSYTNGDNNNFAIEQINYVQGDSTATMLVTPNTVGAESATITLTDDGENINGENSTSKAITIVVVDKETGAGELKNIPVYIYPVPVNNILSIKNASSFSRYQVLNVSGSVILEANISGENFNIDTASLNNGVYYLKLLDDNDFVIKKLLVIHK